VRDILDCEKRDETTVVCKPNHISKQATTTPGPSNYPSHAAYVQRSSVISLGRETMLNTTKVLLSTFQAFPYSMTLKPHISPIPPLDKTLCTHFFHHQRLSSRESPFSPHSNFPPPESYPLSGPIEYERQGFLAIAFARPALFLVSSSV
jgi:hypothetical protein